MKKKAKADNWPQRDVLKPFDQVDTEEDAENHFVKSLFLILEKEGIHNSFLQVYKSHCLFFSFAVSIQNNKGSPVCDAFSSLF